jgi:hypothetical protein
VASSQTMPAARTYFWSASCDPQALIKIVRNGDRLPFDVETSREGALSSRAPSRPPRTRGNRWCNRLVRWLSARWAIQMLKLPTHTGDTEASFNFGRLNRWLIYTAFTPVLSRRIGVRTNVPHITPTKQRYRSPVMVIGGRGGVGVRSFLRYDRSVIDSERKFSRRRHTVTRPKMDAVTEMVINKAPQL